MLKGKNILLAVCGGIAVYKVVDVASRLRKLGANVHVVMTKEATNFVTPLTFQEISGNPVNVSMWDKVTNWNVEHIALANLADLVLIAPATANIIGKIANGIADDMLSTVIMATKAPVFVAPAMNSNMRDYLNICYMAVFLWLFFVREQTRRQLYYRICSMRFIFEILPSVTE